MRKSLLITLGIILASTTSGCSLVPQTGPQLQYLIPPYSINQNPLGQNNEMTLIPSSSPQTNSTTTTTPLNIKFKSIDDAMNNLLALECHYIDQTNNKVIARIKDRKILISSDDPQSKGKDNYILFRYDQAWVWNASVGQGIIVNLTELPTGKGFKMGDKEIRYAGDVIANLEKYKSNCKVVNLVNTIFDPPTNINFAGSNN